MQNKLKKGFTLVELIVVIAIIAILAVVSVVGYNAFIERANLSSDNQTLSSMNNVLKTHTAVNFEELDADDVKYIINTANGEEFNFTPKTKGYGFFYVEDEKQIVLMKYDDFAAEYQSSKLNSSLIKPNQLINKGDTPEEYFGAGKYVLSESGHKVAEMISGLKNLGKSVNVSEDFNKLLNEYNGTEEQDFLYRMGPAYSIFVSDEGWVFANSIQYSRVIFANNTMHIPSVYDLPQSVMDQVKVKVPRSVKSIDEDTFAVFGEKLNMQITNKNIFIADGAFSEQQMSLYGLQVKDIPSLDLVFNGAIYDEEANTLTFSSGQSIDVNLQGLPRSEIYRMYMKSYFQGENSYYLVVAYGKDGIVGQLKLRVLVKDIE